MPPRTLIKHGNQHRHYSQNKIDHRIQDKFRMSFPANAPIITEYSGLAAKNKSLFGKVFYCIKFET
jgi:hypothetical protein